MKIFFLKKGTETFNWQKKVLMIIIIASTCLIGFLMLNQTADVWDEDDQWQVKVYQKGDQMMSGESPWILINEFRMDLTQVEEGEPEWCLKVEDIGAYELWPGISRVVIYYGADLKIIDGYALNKDDQKIMNINDFFQLSLYGPEFFSLSKKRYHNLFLFVKDQWQVELCDDKKRTAWWDKEHPWWIKYESNSPHLKAKLDLE